MSASFRSIAFDRLRAQQEELRRAFAQADPIRHVVIEDFLQPDAARRAEQAFPKPEAMAIAFAGLAEVKRAEQDLGALDAVFAGIFDDLNDPAFVQWLAGVTQIPDLAADPQLHGGGLHQGPDGSYLDVHADFNIHPGSGLFRRLNLLIYLNPRWEPHWQGYLELWSRDMNECRQYIEPKFNRCLIMETHDYAFHGYKELRLPAGVTRKSLAAYYYSPVRSEKQTEAGHNTLFRLRPQQQRAAGVQMFFRRLIALSPPALRGPGRALRDILRIPK
ncbi:MAG: 2OG-Fe(II) oxygenase [Candidatus Baltobacteraceae bacterium]